MFIEEIIYSSTYTKHQKDGFYLYKILLKYNNKNLNRLYMLDNEDKEHEIKLDEINWSIIDDKSFLRQVMYRYNDDIHAEYI